MKKFIIKFSIYIIFLITQNSIAGKAIIEHPEPFYASEVAFFDEELHKRYIDQFDNKTILLVFWASWCGSCIDNMKNLDLLAKDFKKLDLQIIAVSEDYQGVDVIKRFYAENEIRFLEIFHDYQNAMFRDMGIISVPTAYIIEPEGKVRVILKGEIKWHDESIRKLILNHIKGNPELPKNSYKESGINLQLSKKMIDNPANSVNNNNIKNQKQQYLQEDKEDATNQK